MTKDGLYGLYEYRDEKELEDMVRDNWRFIFGSDSFYFPIKQKLESKAKVRVTDGLLLDLASRRFWIVELELSKHDVYREVEPQIRGFIRALGSEETLSKIRNIIYDGITGDVEKMRHVRAIIGPDLDLHYFIDKLLHEKCGIVIVIDDKTPQLEELVEDFSSSHEVRVIEFRTYARGKERVHSFTPLAHKLVQREVPEIQRSWKARLEWTKPETRRLVEKIITEVEKLPEVVHKPAHRWYLFFKSKEKPNHIFLALLLGKKKVQMRICADPRSFTDPKGLAKDYKGWFFKRGGREKGFFVHSPEELDYALGLVRQSYERVRIGLG